MIIEMVGYTAIHSSEVDKWRCILCEGLVKYSQEDLQKHLIDFHSINKDDLRLEKDAFLQYPSVEKETAN